MSRRVPTPRMNENAPRDEISLSFPSPHLKSRLSRLNAPLSYDGTYHYIIQKVYLPPCCHGVAGRKFEEERWKKYI